MMFGTPPSVTSLFALDEPLTVKSHPRLEDWRNTVLISASTVFANEPKGGAPDYSGISTMYYALIGIVLAYGVYDTFFKKS